MWGRGPAGRVRTVTDAERGRTLVRALAPHRRRYGVAWDRTLGEIQAGIRRSTGQRREHYQQIIAFDAEGSSQPPEPHETPLGDYLRPYRPGRPTTVINAVSRAVGDDCAGWSWERLVVMAGQLKREREARADG